MKQEARGTLLYHAADSAQSSEPQALKRPEAHAMEFDAYLQGESTQPLLLLGNALTVLASLPTETIDFVMTSPPYWGSGSTKTVALV